MKKLLLLLVVVLLASCRQSAPIVDSDGDGYSDVYEDERFNSDIPLKYNKFVSDLPLVDIRMASEPVISINYEGVISKTITSASSYSGTSSNSTTTSREWTDEVDMSVGASLTDFGVSLSASSTYTFGRTTTNSYSSTFERSREYERSSQVAFKEAKIVVPVYIRNIGTTPIIINDMILTAYIEDWRGNIRVIGNLTVDNSELGTLALDGNSSDVIIGFKNDTLYPSELESLFRDARSVSVVLSSMEVEDKSYYDMRNKVASRTARLSILHSTPNLSRKFDILVKEDTLENLLNLAQIQYDDKLLYVDNERANFHYDGYTWSINHKGIRDNSPFNNSYTLVNPVDLSDIIVKQGDIITFYRDDVHWEDSPLGRNGDDLFNYYDDFAKIKFIGEIGEGYSSNYWNPQYVTHLSRMGGNRNTGDFLQAEMFHDTMPENIYISFKDFPMEVMVNDKIIDIEYMENGEAGSEYIVIKNLTPVTRIEFRFITGTEGIFTRYVQSYTIDFRE